MLVSEAKLQAQSLVSRLHQSPVGRHPLQNPKLRHCCAPATCCRELQQPEHQRQRRRYRYHSYIVLCKLSKELIEHPLCLVAQKRL